LPRILIKDLTVRFNDRIILRIDHLEIGEGVTVVFGRNGSGKTTLLRSIMGLIDYEGEVFIDGVNTRRMSRQELSRLIGYVWQNPYYGFIENSVKEEIEVILRNLRVNGNWDIVDRIVPKHLMNRDPSTLSGGEARRVSIASILVADQRIWLLDEPFTNMDRDGVLSLIDLINNYRSRGKTIVIALHEVFYAYIINPDHYIILDDGRVVSSGKWSDFNNVDVRKYGLIPLGEICA